MESTGLLNQLLARNSISDYLPYQAYNAEKDCYVLDTGIGIMFECAALQYPSKNHLDMMKSLFEASFIPQTSVQFLLYASPHIDPLLDAYVLSRKTSGGESVFTEATKQRKALYSKGSKESILRGNNVKIRNFQLFVSMTIPCERTPDGYNKCLKDRVDKYRETLRQVLNAMGMGPTPVPPEKLNRLLMELLNPSHEITDYSYDPTVHIKDQVVYADSGLRVTADHLKIDRKYCQSLTVKQYPEEWNFGNNMDFVGSLYENAKQIAVPFLLVMNCEYPDQVKDGASVQKRALSAKYQSFGDFAKWFPELQIKKRNFDILLYALENESLFFSYFNIFFFARTEKEMYDVNQAFKSLYRTVGVILQDDPYISLPLFLQMLPMGYNAQVQKELKRRNTRSTGVVSALLPLYADWGGTGRPVIQLISRRGQLQYFDVFSNRQGGYSSVVVAATGAGKSFFVNEMTIGYLGVGTKIWTIDVGRSYQKLCEAVGGSFVAFNPNSEICLNPFTYVKDLNEEMPMLKSIMAQMASREPLDDLSMSFIEEAIREQHSKYEQELMVNHVIEYLLSKGDTRQKELGIRMYPYSKKGSYSRFFNGYNSLGMDNDYIVYELDELKSKKDLQEVVLLALVYQIQQEMLKRDRQKLVLIDEAWDLLSGGNTSAFMESAYRRFRKNNGACCTITQSVNDFYKIPAGVAIIENSDYFWLLRQRPESIEALKKTQRLSLSDGMYDLLRSIHTDVNNYSEIFCYTPDGITIGRLVVDRFTQLLYTTKPDEYQAIKNYIDRGMTLNQAIAQVMADEQKK